MKKTLVLVSALAFAGVSTVAAAGNSMKGQKADAPANTHTESHDATEPTEPTTASDTGLENDTGAVPTPEMDETVGEPTPELAPETTPEPN